MTIEQYLFEVNSYEFWIENESLTSHYFKYEKFAESVYKGRYLNTNLYAYTDKIIRGNYQLKIKLVTTDTTLIYQTNFDLNENVTGASITSLIGKSDSGKTYLKDLKIVYFTKVENNLISLKLKNKPKLNFSPVFEIKNKSTYKLFPYNHYGHYYGSLAVLKDKEWKSYCYVKPYEKFTCELEVEKQLLCYLITDPDCSPKLIDSKGKYKFQINVCTDPIELDVPSDLVKAGELRIRKFECYSLEYEFNLK